MTSRLLILAASALALSSCDWMPGKPSLADKWTPPEAITGFQDLYRMNCLGCHGDGNSIAGSITLKNPVYLATISRETLRDIIANGVAGHNMPSFSKENGGPLDDSQIETLVNGILAWRDPAALPAAPVPPYSAPLGDTAAGAKAFGGSCASCHGADGDAGPKAGSVVNHFYLDLVSDQYLRTVTIAGRPELGCADFTNRTPGNPMTPDSVSDIVAWLASHRKNEFGQPSTPTGAQP